MSSFLEATNISKAFDGVQALESVSIAIDAGEIHCFVGENGSGKSTLIKIIGGVLTPDSGEIRINGQLFRPARAIDSIRKGIQIIYQDLSLFPNLSVAENISLNQLIERGNTFVSKTNILQTAQKALKEIEEELDLSEKVENLSMSKRQIVAISRALTQNARLIYYGRTDVRHNQGRSGSFVFRHYAFETKGDCDSVRKSQIGRGI